MNHKSAVWLGLIIHLAAIGCFFFLLRFGDLPPSEKKSAAAIAFQLLATLFTVVRVGLYLSQKKRAFHRPFEAMEFHGMFINLLAGVQSLLYRQTFSDKTLVVAILSSSLVLFVIKVRYLNSKTAIPLST